MKEKNINFVNKSIRNGKKKIYLKKIIEIKKMKRKKYHNFFLKIVS